MAQSSLFWVKSQVVQDVYKGFLVHILYRCVQGTAAAEEAAACHRYGHGRRSAAGSVNRTEYGSSGSLRPSAPVHYGRKDTFRPELTEPARRPPRAIVMGPDRADDADRLATVGAAHERAPLGEGALFGYVPIV